MRKDVIKRALAFDGKATVSVLDTTGIKDCAARLHGYAPKEAGFLGKTLTVCAFMGASLGERDKLSVTLDGPEYKIIAAADYGAKVRGFLGAPTVDGGGYIGVIKDLGLKEPYAGKIPLVDNDLAKAFACYFAASEQIPTAVALGSDKTCGGVVVQALPGCDEETLFLLEDSISHFSDFSKLLEIMNAGEILEYYFGHFGLKALPDVYPTYECACSEDKIKGVISGLGEREARDILAEAGAIEVHCDFCEKNYRFNETDVNRIFEK